jgi:hypothetical protein
LLVASGTTCIYLIGKIRSFKAHFKAKKILECWSDGVGPYGNQYWNVRIIRWAYGETNIGILESSGGPMQESILDCQCDGVGLCSSQYWNVRIIRWAHAVTNIGMLESSGGPMQKQILEYKIEV